MSNYLLEFDRLLLEDGTGALLTEAGDALLNEGSGNRILMEDGSLLVIEFTDASTAPAGVSATSALGTAVATGAAVTSPSGVAVTSALGSATEGGSAAIAPSGVAATSAIGTPTESADAAFNVAGVASLSAVGTPTTSGAAAIALSGVEATSAVGTITASGVTAAIPDGVSATADVGAVVVSGTATVLVEGVEATSAVGDVIAGEAPDVVVPPPVVEPERIIGTTADLPAGMILLTRSYDPADHDPFVMLSIAATASPQGVEARGAVGHAIATGGAAITLDGSDARATTGRVLVFGAKNPTDAELLTLLLAA